jgi:hypothetical protein
MMVSKQAWSLLLLLSGAITVLLLQDMSCSSLHMIIPEDQFLSNTPVWEVFEMPDTNKEIFK